MRPVVLVAAVARNGAIGLENGLPWRLPSDMRHFRATTMGKPVLMGRRTWLSVGRPLPGRFVIVLSRDPAYAPADVARASSLDDGLILADALADRHGADEIVVAGGAEIYATSLARAALLRLTEVDLAPDADSFFPEVDPSVWRQRSREPQIRGAKDEAGFAFVEWERR